MMMDVHTAFHSSIIFTISTIRDAMIMMLLSPGNTFNPKPWCLFDFQD
jgi:hypothetical protein